jgi:hypothetical protein
MVFPSWDGGTHPVLEAYMYKLLFNGNKVQPYTFVFIIVVFTDGAWDMVAMLQTLSGKIQLPFCTNGFIGIKQ